MSDVLDSRTDAERAAEVLQQLDALRGKDTPKETMMDRPVRPAITEYVITDAEIPFDRLILGDPQVDADKGPSFTISEIAKTFFARSPNWVRWRERSGLFVYDGKPVGTQRTDFGARVYNLADIEKIAHALAERNIINGEELMNVLRLVLIMSKIWGLIGSTGLPVHHGADYYPKGDDGLDEDPDPEEVAEEPGEEAGENSVENPVENAGEGSPVTEPVE